MGATILLFNRYDRLIQKTISSASGEFSFGSLVPDLYSVRITLASFVPALKKNISIQPGMRSVLAINLATILSSIELISTGPSTGTLMSDDWKWVLRSTMTSRPVLRFLPRIDITDPAERQRSSSNTAMFSDTRGMVRVSSGETNPFSSAGDQPDLGTTFALATSLYGNNHLQFSGNIGYAVNSATPATGFRTSFSHSDSGPVVKLTVQQLSFPAHGLSPVLGGQTQDNVPGLRTMSLTMLDRVDITDSIDLEYGASLDSVTFMDRLNYVSPFARLNYHLGGKGTVSVAYSSGMPPLELIGSSKDEDASLQQDISALTMFPRVSVRNGSPAVQRTQTMETGYRITEGSRTYSIGFYHESVNNGALTMTAPSGFYDSSELLPELSSINSVFNIGKYSRTGMMASISQSLGENFALTLAYGDGGTLRTDGRKLMTDDPDELRGMIHRAQHQWVMGRISGVVPVTGTKFVSSYEWTDYRSLMPGHVYLVQKIYPEAGLNIRLRQPIPQFGGLPGRLEATAEFRNMLAQGYLPIATTDNRKLILTNSPRAVRGGVSFIF